jgi:tetratricopeptide (TPR) repeat protein
MRRALEYAPNWYELHDTRALTLWRYGFEAEARQAVRESAQALPIIAFHSYVRVADLPRWFLDEFAAGSWAVLGRVPLVSRTAQLVDLGKLERMRGEDQRAADALSEMLASGGGDADNRAEAHFHLGLALISLGRREEGAASLERAAEHPVFLLPALSNLATAAEQAGDLQGALGYLRRLRSEQPENLDYCLEFARVAGRQQNWAAAVEALQWARVTHARNLLPYAALIHIRLSMGDVHGAAALLREVEGWPEAAAPPEQIRELRRAVERAGASR